jgi:hypothetical protein
MFKRAVLLLSPAELSGYLNEYRYLFPSDLVMAATPDVYSVALEAGLTNIIFPDWVREFCAYDHADYVAIQGAAKRLEEGSSDVRASIFGGRQLNCDWNFQSNFFLAFMAITAKKFADVASVRLREFEEVCLFSVAHAGEFYFDSSFQSGLVHRNLRANGCNARIIFLSDSYRAKTFRADIYRKIPDIFASSTLEQWRSRGNVALVAACAMYGRSDQSKIFSIINQYYSNCTPVAYPVPLWPVFKPDPIFEQLYSVELVAKQLVDRDLANVMRYVDWLTETTEQFFSKLIADGCVGLPEGIVRQYVRFRERHFFQCLTFVGWRNLLRESPSAFLGVSAQDSCINGPMVSAAVHCAVPVVVFPHSKIVNWRTPSRCTVATDWWQPKPSESLWGEANEHVYFDASKPVVGRRSSLSLSKSRWTIIYNGTQENIFSSVSFNYLLSTVLTITRAALDAERDVTHRLKPGDQTPMAVYCKLLGIDEQSALACLRSDLGDLIDQSELIFGIDEPSSALWEALLRGCAVILVTDRDYSFESLSDDDILSPVSSEKLQELLQSFYRNPSALEEYRGNQQRKLLEVKRSRVRLVV